MSKTYLDILKEHYPSVELKTLYDDFCIDEFMESVNTKCNDNCAECWNTIAHEEAKLDLIDVEVPEDWSNPLPNGKIEENPLPESSVDTSVEVSDVQDENTETEIKLAPDTVEKLNDKGVATLKLSIRNHNAILRAGCRTIGDIIRNADKLKDVAPKAYEEAAQVLQSMGVHLPDVVEGVITYIDVRKIEPHPHNPRKDVGDVTELAESIKANGIMQNLTVVPWFAENDTLDPEGKVNGWYRALIGHRRLAAAKKAGLHKVPCVIARDLTLNEQVAIMLAENMQRSDLSVVEQAEGIQMMLDLGDTVDTVAEKTGLSQSTVRRRVKLMDYDTESVKESFERGGTLEDYEKLEKIKDPEKRAELVKKIGTNNFSFNFDQALSEQKQKENKEYILKLLSFAEEIDEADYSVMSSVKTYYFSDDRAVHTLPKDYDEEKKYYIVTGHNWITLYIEDEKVEVDIEDEDTEERRRETELEKRSVNLNEIFTLMKERRRQFIRNFKSFPQEKVTDTLERIYKIQKVIANDEALQYPQRVYLSSYANLLDFVSENPTDEEKKEVCELFGVEQFKDTLYLEKVFGENGINNAMRFVYYVFLKLDISYVPYYTTSCRIIEAYLNKYKRLYDFLQLCGYELSDEEQAIINGTHELYVKESDNE